jgi:pimeloyl-ACP methyl ester carboxylesterase
VADHFVKRGIASLIYDKRGCGESDGNWLDLLDHELSFPLLAEDALAGLRFLQGQNNINASQVGFCGFSQGGWLGPLAASSTPDAAFVICVSGAGVGPDEQMAFTIRNRLTAEGLTTEEIERALSERTRAAGLARRIAASGEGWSEMTELARDASTTRWASFVPPSSFGDVADLEANLRPFIELLAHNPEYRYDPVPALENLTCPLLVIWGEADQLIPVEKSVAVFREALERSGNADLTIRIFPQADHNLLLPDGSLAPDFWESMTDWLRQRMGADRGNGS